MVQSPFVFFAGVAMTATLASKQTALKRRIRQFYNALNRRDFEKCHQMIDPRVRAKPTSVTLHQYENSLAQFLDEHGLVDVREITIDLHLDEPSPLYEGRDFAVGRTTWVDEQGNEQTFSERWVRDGRAWFTRSTGFVVTPPPGAAKVLARK
jgi:hypothetical protein